MTIWNHGDYRPQCSYSWSHIGVSLEIGAIGDKYVLILRDTDANELVSRLTGSRSSIYRKADQIIAQNDAANAAQ